MLYDRRARILNIPFLNIDVVFTFLFFSASHSLCLSTHTLLSEDYGKSFQDITELINGTFINTAFGIAIGPENSGKVGCTVFLTL